MPESSYIHGTHPEEQERLSVLNELINGATLCFCMTCGRILYLADEDIPNTRRTVR